MPNDIFKNILSYCDKTETEKKVLEKVKYDLVVKQFELLIVKTKKFSSIFSDDYWINYNTFEGIENILTHGMTEKWCGGVYEYGSVVFIPMLWDSDFYDRNNADGWVYFDKPVGGNTIDNIWRDTIY